MKKYSFVIIGSFLYYIAWSGIIYLIKLIYDCFQ